MNYIAEIYELSTKNKYAKWYIELCTLGQTNRNLEYTERHHIIPKFMNGSNSRKNITKLSGREHFVAHLLLTKMVESPNLIIRARSALGAFMSQNKNGARRLSSRQLEIARKSKSESQKNKKFTPEHKEKIRQSLLGKKKSQEHIENNRLAHTGKTLSRETVARRSKSKKENLDKLKKENPELYYKKKESFARKNSKGQVFINGIEYTSVQSASRGIGRNPDYIARRLSSDDFPDWIFVSRELSLKNV